MNSETWEGREISDVEDNVVTGRNSKLSRNAVGRPPERVDVQCQVTKRCAHLSSSFTPQKQNCKSALKTSAHQV